MRPPTILDAIPGRPPRLPAWAAAFRAAGWPLRDIANLFDAERADLIEAGVAP